MRPSKPDFGCGRHFFWPMPWTSKDAKRFTSFASGEKKSRQWMHTANSVYKRTGDEGSVVRAANSVVHYGRGRGPNPMRKSPRRGAQMRRGVRR